MTDTFASILDKPASEVERPKPLPVGTYVAVVQGPAEHGKSSKKQTPFVRFNLKILQAGEDVDAEELVAMGGIEDKVIKDTYYITEESLYRLKEFLTNCGIEDNGQSIRQMLDDAPGQQVTLSMKHEASENGESIFARVGGTAPVI